MNIPKLYAKEVKKRPIDMTLSVNPLGCSLRVVNAFTQLQPRDISEYPNLDVLLKAGCKQFSIPQPCLVVGNGSEQLIKLIAQTVINTNDTVFVQSGSFSVFTKESILAGATVRWIDPFNLPIDTFPKAIFLCNPNNPTGELLPQNRIKKIITLFPKSIIVIDEANGEFTTKSCIKLALKQKNVLILRTCSKAFGLAGLRVGFLIGNASLLEKFRVAQQSFPLSTLAIKLTAIGLQDKKFLQNTIRFISKERASMKRSLTKRGFTVSKSVTNTLFIKTPIADMLVQKLDTLGVSVISNTFFPGLNIPGFRIALRDTKTNHIFLKKLDRAIESVSTNLIP